MMKRAFLFDDEPISGITFWQRMLLGHILIALFGLGIWIQATSAFKRAGRFGWRRKYRVLTAIVMPGFSISTIVGYTMGSSLEELPAVLVVNSIASCVCTLFVSVNGQQIQQSDD